MGLEMRLPHVVDVGTQVGLARRFYHLNITAGFNTLRYGLAIRFNVCKLNHGREDGVEIAAGVRRKPKAKPIRFESS
ncbi:hypothetical protein L0F63_002758 [Massospora cicadina]|nr:hypothetical protein L0F63_002758 [Massospora cicadina]